MNENSSCGTECQEPKSMSDYTTQEEELKNKQTNMPDQINQAENPTNTQEILYAGKATFRHDLIEEINSKKSTVAADMKMNIETMASPNFSLQLLEKTTPPVTIAALLAEMVSLCRASDIVLNAK